MQVMDKNAIKESMKIAVGADGKAGATDAVIKWLQERGYDVQLFGALTKDPDAWLWPKVAQDVAQGVASGKFDQGILFCWTGTGISMAANKVPGIRAALCADAETAKSARIWNDANILAMSLRSTSEEIAREILEAWFTTSPSQKPQDVKCIDYLKAMEAKPQD